MEKYSAPDSFLYKLERVDMNYGLPTEEYLKEAGDADFIVADAIAPVPGDLIRAMPNLKLIHSEGVAYNLIDKKAAEDCFVYVCNSAGMNASAVAEQTVLLMLGMLRNVIAGDAAVRNGHQIEMKENYMREGTLKELADCSVALVGFGHIATHTAAILRAFGVSKIYYSKRNPFSPEEDRAMGVSSMPLSTLLAQSDIVSLHLPVTKDTAGIANASFFRQMKDGSYFVNTSRGELVDDQALADALSGGKLAMAGLDTLDNEPVRPDHPLLSLPEEISKKLLFSPHIGGITASSFRRSYAMIWEDIEDAANGKTPKRII